ncbi:shikimate kinase [Marinicella litoralis]|uniref:Shikimate kinase n=2 Tax=Marinicella litoralis TaxID=644220 RepID=A0A4R6XSM7_9GAMM|nr:shikimate kinase [Marinicella litoralis]
MQSMTINSRNIILVGPMGAGKTTVGKQIAIQLQKKFIDIDQELEKRTGVSINLIFEIEKEAGFRTRETAMLAELLQLENAVIATGGGIVGMEENRQLLQQTDGLVVYLKTEVKHQLKRLKRDKQRPLLQGEGRRERLLKLARMRNPLYDQVADVAFASGRTSSYGMAKKVVDHLKNPEKLKRIK